MLVSSLTAYPHAWWNRGTDHFQERKDSSLTCVGISKRKSPSPWDCQPAPLSVPGMHHPLWVPGMNLSVFFLVYLCFFFSIFQLVCQGHMALWNLPNQGIEPVPRALEAQNPNSHWTSGSPGVYSYNL